MSFKIPNQTFAAPPELAEGFLPQGYPISFRKGAVLFRENTEAKGIFIVVTGHVTLSVHSPEGETLFARESGPGCIIGLPGTFLGGTYQLTATADADSHFVFVPRRRVLEFLRENLRLFVLVVEILAREASPVQLFPILNRRLEEDTRGGQELTVN